VFFYDADACIGVFLRASGKSCLIDTTGLNDKGGVIRKKGITVVVVAG
jgi:hypothetical protein